MYQKFVGYSARFATPEDADAVYDFYNSDKRPAAVYLRNKDLITNQVAAGLFFTVWHDDKIIAASTAYPLAGGKRIDCIVDAGRVVEAGSVVELGSVLKRIDTANENGETPRNFFHGMLFGVPMIEAFRRAGEEAGYPHIDLLVANVQPALTDTIHRLTTGYPDSPHKWRIIKAAPELLRAFGETTQDPNALREKQYYRASIKNLPDVARYLLEAAQQGCLTNSDGDELHIDMSGLPLQMYRAIDINRGFFENSPRQLSWNETRRLFEPSIPLEKGPMIRPADGFGQQNYGLQNKNGIKLQGSGDAELVSGTATIRTAVSVGKTNGTAASEEKKEALRPDSDFPFSVMPAYPAATPGGRT